MGLIRIRQVVATHRSGLSLVILVGRTLNVVADGTLFHVVAMLIVLVPTILVLARCRAQGLNVALSGLQKRNSDSNR